MTIQEQHVLVLENLLAALEGKTDCESDPPSTSASYLREFIGRAIALAPTMQPDKIGRWTGFVQGVMASRGWLCVQAERDRTRGVFSAARE